MIPPGGIITGIDPEVNINIEMKKKPLFSVNQIIFYLSVLILIMAVVPLFIISRYNFMSADDYSYIQPSIAAWRANHSVFEVLKDQFVYAYHYYFDWQGTFSMEWLGSSIMVMIAEDHYYIGTFLTLGGLVVSELILFMLIGIKALGGDVYNTGIVSCLLVVFQILMVPYPVESFYWLCGSLLYTMGFNMTVLLYALMFIYLRHSYRNADAPLKPGAKMVFLQIGIIILSILISFGNFISAIFGFASFICLVFAVWVRKLRGRVIVTLNAAVYSAFFIINVLAPGNRSRMDATGVEKNSIILSLLKSFGASGKYIISNLYPTVILLILLMIPFIIGIVKNKAMNGKKTFRFPIIFTLITYCLYTSQFVPTMYSLGILGAGRVINIYRLSLYILLFANVIYWTGWILRKIHEKKPGLRAENIRIKKCFLLPGLVMGGAAFLVAAYFYGGVTLTSVSAIKSLRSGQAAQYEAEYLERLKVLNDDSVTDVTFDAFSSPPYLLFFEDIKYDANEWQNVHMARFYNKNSVVLRRPE